MILLVKVEGASSAWPTQIGSSSGPERLALDTRAWRHWADRGLLRGARRIGGRKRAHPPHGVDRAELQRRQSRPRSAPVRQSRHVDNPASPPCAPATEPPSPWTQPWGRGRGSTPASSSTPAPARAQPQRGPTRTGSGSPSRDKPRPAPAARGRPPPPTTAAPRPKDGPERPAHGHAGRGASSWDPPRVRASPRGHSPEARQQRAPARCVTRAPSRGEAPTISRPTAAQEPPYAVLPSTAIGENIFATGKRVANRRRRPARQPCSCAALTRTLIPPHERETATMRPAIAAAGSRPHSTRRRQRRPHRPSGVDPRSSGRRSSEQSRPRPSSRPMSPRPHRRRGRETCSQEG